jgi:hypothetical protein
MQSNIPTVRTDEVQPFSLPKARKGGGAGREQRAGLLVVCARDAGADRPSDKIVCR